MMTTAAVTGLGALCWFAANDLPMPDGVRTPILVAKAMLAPGDEATAVRLVALNQPEEDLPPEEDLETIFHAPGEPAPLRNATRKVPSAPVARDHDGPVRTRIAGKRLQSRPAGEDLAETPTAAPASRTTEPETTDGRIAAETVAQTKSFDSTWIFKYQSTEQKHLHERTIGTGEFRTLVLGGLDGTDVYAVKWIDSLGTQLASDRLRLDGHQVLLVRAVNPDGLTARKTTNSRDVLINRNFPTRNFDFSPASKSGKYPGSEVETRAVLQWLTEFRPHRVVVLQSSADVAPEVSVNERAAAVASDLKRRHQWQARGLSNQSGALDVFVNETMPIEMVTLELPNPGARYQEAWEKHRAAVERAILFGGSGGELARNTVRPQDEPTERTLPDTIRRSREFADTVADDRTPVELTYGNDRARKNTGYIELPPPPTR